MKRIISLLILIQTIIFSHFAFSNASDTNKVYGVTIDNISNLNAIRTSLRNLPKKMTTRIVFDEWMPATYYNTAVQTIHQVSYVMGEILDSWSFSQYNLTQYINRVNEYISTLGNNVDIWEFGNEINGEWLGNTTDVIQKISSAYNILKSNNKTTALTFYYNYECWENPQNEMFYWIHNYLPSYMKTGIDYVWVSYYEDDCNNYQPNWQKVFDSLKVIFPNSKIGIGECGTTKVNKKEEYMRRYYTMKVTTKNYVGGYFWWYYKQDCVPYTKYLWGVLKEVLNTIPTPGIVIDTNNLAKVFNYPNPFNPSTKIYYKVPQNSNVKITLFDAVGREILILLNEYKAQGEYILDFNANNLASGIYFYKMEMMNTSVTNKMILLK
ncbi:MAG: T9SS type A sorting domain-containing protein [Ignavibacteria bacterium]|nr:T9SS type A sorting domain-containing protein [Ignavibacteria bacterium]